MKKIVSYRYTSRLWKPALELTKIKSDSNPEATSILSVANHSSTGLKTLSNPSMTLFKLAMFFLNILPTEATNFFTTYFSDNNNRIYKLDVNAQYDGASFHFHNHTELINAIVYNCSALIIPNNTAYDFLLLKNLTITSHGGPDGGPVTTETIELFWRQMSNTSNTTFEGCVENIMEQSLDLNPVLKTVLYIVLAGIIAYCCIGACSVSMGRTTLNHRLHNIREKFQNWKKNRTITQAEIMVQAGEETPIMAFEQR